MEKRAIIPVLPARVIDKEGAFFVLSETVCKPETHDGRCDSAGRRFEDIDQGSLANTGFSGGSGMAWSGEQILLLCLGNVHKVRVSVIVTVMRRMYWRSVWIAMSLEVSHMLGDVLGLCTDVHVVRWLEREI